NVAPNCKIITTILILMILSGKGFIHAQSLPVNLSQTALTGNVEFIPDGNGSYVLKAGSSNGGLLINDRSVLDQLSSFKYMVIGVTHHNPYSGILHIEFFAGDPVTKTIAADPRLSVKAGILPDLHTWLVFPFSYLDGQEVFLPRMPRQLKGVVFGRRTDPDDVAAIKLIPGPYQSPRFTPEFIIDTIYLSNELPAYTSKPSEPVADKFGQWYGHDWPGRTASDDDFNNLKQAFTELAGEELEFPGELSRYGGWRKLRFDSTGFFHTRFDSERWWFVDPEGYAFLSLGMDCVRPTVSSTLSGDEDLYEWLPPEDSAWPGVYFDSRGQKMTDFFKINMIKMFGPNWQQEWGKITRNKLVGSGFNTVGNWSDMRFARQSHLPYMLPLSGFPTTEVNLFRDFPDVFSPQYKVNSEKFASQLAVYRDDPFLIGYFLRNEPQWAFGDHDIAFEMFASQDMSFSKLAFVRWLVTSYGNDVEVFNKAWDLDLNDFADLNLLTFKTYPSEKSKQDFMNFSGQMVDRYVGTVCDEVRKVDPNHLNLGMRYAYISSDLLYRAGDYFDVFSINGYNAPGPPPTAQIFEKTGKPVLIGEFHFGAIDRGLPSTGLRGVASTKDRGKAYRYYVEQGFSRPELIGIHYFQWMDQPILGRFDGENYNIGFNDIVYRSYPGLFKAASKTHQRVYHVALGKRKAYSHKAKPIPVIAF
ncbi:MAG TPA: beta-galactosidase, partial [Bacteroidales bacterium]|nr:beta-galactosidase [Bacteroidales bacterium]